MEHILKLQPKYFDYINNGTKRIELRLYDEKRQKIAIGDTIIFQKEPKLETTMKVKVIGLLRYNTFEELFEDFDIEMMADEDLKKELERIKPLCELQAKLYNKEMVKHEFLGSYRKQKATYSDGTTVIIDLDRNTYKIDYEQSIYEEMLILTVSPFLL